MMSLERIKGETMATEEKNSNVLTKALSILEYMSRQKKRVSIQELSQELGISSPSVHRILQALKADGYIQQEKNKQYSLTYKLLELSSYSMMHDGLIEQVLPFMNYFAQQKNCQVGLSVLYEESILHLATVGQFIVYNDKYALPGTVLPAYCTAAGKLFLSQLDDETLETWVRSHNLVPYTANTIIDPEELLKQIRQTRERGYGIVISELYDFVACISIPDISQVNRVLGALNFSTKPEHFDTLNNEKFISDVTNTIRNAQFH